MSTRWIALALFAATLALYSPVRRFDFVNYDDPEDVTRNPHVRRGITLDGVKWAVVSGQDANWFPLTRLSHMLDAELFGLRGGLHHLSSVLFHALAAVLLFLFLTRATGQPWPAALAAFLFALHPLHVESVAWIAERKDVLCAMFWFLGLWAYVAGRKWLVAVAFCLGLMSKPMIVTFPVVLLLLDYWPLGRFSRKAVREKIPYFALAAAGSLAAWFAQRAGGAVQELTLFPLPLRIENAIVTCAVYILRMFWPARLAVFYPYPPSYPAWQVAGSALALAAISALAIRFRRERPWLLMGWLWYLCTLAPVIGLVQIGGQARADRYTYVPMAGLAVMLAWGLFDALRWRPAVAVSAAACLACVPLARAQIGYWENSGTLFRHALEATGDGNYVGHHNLALYLKDQPGQLPEAVSEFRAALRIKPDIAKWHNNLGLVLTDMPEMLPEAVAELREAVRLDPSSPENHNNLGLALSKTPGGAPEAIAEFRAALRIKPDYPEANSNLGMVLSSDPARLPEAIAGIRESLRVNPESAEAHNNLGLALSKMPGRLNDAVAEFQTALRLRQKFPEAHNNLGMAYLNVPERLPDAIAEFQAALRAKPDSAEAHNNLGLALARSGRIPEAIPEFQAALRLKPGFAEAHGNLGMALSATAERLPEAVAEFQAALRLEPDSAVSHNNLGMALARTPGRMPQAIDEFRAATRLQPDYAQAHYNLGIALSQFPGRRAEAIAEMEAGLRLKPDPEFRQILEQIRAGR